MLLSSFFEPIYQLMCFNEEHIQGDSGDSPSMLTLIVSFSNTFFQKLIFGIFKYTLRPYF